MRSSDYILGLHLHYSLLQAAHCPIREAHLGVRDLQSESGHPLPIVGQVLRGDAPKPGEAPGSCGTGAREEQTNRATYTGTQAMPSLVR